MPRYVEDIEVWRAAQQVINQYPEEPELAAPQRADAAYEVGDMFNFELWRRVAKAVRELVRTKPEDGKAIN
jgi:hypothetical protein